MGTSLIIEPVLHLNVGAKIMLTRNLWIKKGLCNGAAMGIVKTIIYKEGQYPPVLSVAV